MENRSARGDGWVQAASVIFCIISALLALYVSFKYVFALILPILIGAAVGTAASALASKLSRYTRASKRVVSFAVLLTLLGSLVALLFFGIRRLTDELGRLAQSISSGEGEIFNFFKEAIEFAEVIGEKLSALIPSGTEETADKINALVESIIGNLLSELGSTVPGTLSAILRALPEILLGVIVTVIVAFYFTLDGDRIKSGIKLLLPKSANRIITRIKKEAAVAAIGYMRSYSLILLITFAEIFFGLSVLGVEYSFLIAAISAAVDILPVFGVGIILLPWAVYCLITRELFLGIGLIILYVIILVVRQFIEPKIVGENLGIHPLLTLASFYLGYRIFGFIGILLAPILLILQRAFKSRSEEDEITHP
jgi:sporulation integral membrane protein YtvI